jgi:hypothetical protein
MWGTPLFFHCKQTNTRYTARERATAEHNEAQPFGWAFLFASIRFFKLLTSS